jgi:hypothetical protein
MPSSGPQLIALPQELQLRVLLWVRDNASLLEPLATTLTAMLSSFCGCLISSGASGMSLHSTAQKLLEYFSKQQISSSSTLLDSMDAFAAALHADLNAKLATDVPLVTGALYYQSALREFSLAERDRIEGGQRHRNKDGDRPFYMDVTAPTDTFSLALYEEPDMDVGIGNNMEITDSPVIPTDTSLFDESQTALLPSSQMDTMPSTIEMDVSSYAEASIEPPLSEGDQSKVSALSEKLEALDGNLLSQSSLTYPDISILVDTASPVAACEALKLANHSDETILVLLTCLLAQDASFARLTILLKAALQSKVNALEKASSRSLLSALNLAASHQSRALLESVLVPAVSQSTFSAPQVELTLRIMKSLDHAIQDTYAENLILAPTIWNLSHLELLAKILPLRSPWPLTVISKFISQLHLHLHDPYEGNKAGDKIVTLVWSIVQKYAAKDLAPHKETLKSIVSRFTTTLSEKAIAKIQAL